ncbi:hypothetical protein BX265_0506 [Streptomyces sp. TLI_235]|nr:hypothetical protein BX265_0506 [Streptomyces sp. TLI_235]
MHRGPATIGGAASGIEGRESWRIECDEEFPVVLHDAGAPGALARRRVKQGIHGTYKGADLTITGSGSIAPKSRHVTWRCGTDVLTFKTGKFKIHLVNPDGSEIAVKRAGEWHITEAASPDQILAVCVFEWAELDSLLEFPLLAMF